MKLQVKMRPLEPYFLGSERCAPFGEYLTQRSLRNPYFLRSNRLPSQSMLFGVLRYLGIQRPQVNFYIQDSVDNIGPHSFQLLEEKQDFGRIRSIGPLMLVDDQGQHYLPTPKNHIAVQLEERQKEAFVPYRQFTPVQVGTGEKRWVPEEYSEKNWDAAEFLCLETGTLIGSPFETQVKVGINRASRHKADPLAQSGFFKKEYVILKREYSFVFQADVRRDFWYAASRVVQVGQGHTPFAVTVEQVPSFIDWTQQRAWKTCFPELVNITGSKEPCKVRYALALSDLYFEGEIAQLRNHCCLMLALNRDYRVFTTNYQPEESSVRRYQKHPDALKLITAGSVFLFSDKRQQQSFRKVLEQGDYFNTGKTAGFNHLYYSGVTEGGDKR